MKKTLSLVTLLAAGASQAAGFGVDTQDARCTGMANACTAAVNNASAIYSNAANLVGIDGKLAISLGVTGILPSLTFTPAGGAEQGQKTTLSPPPHLYVAFKPFEKAAFGVGVFTAFGARSRWEDDFIGRGRALESNLASYYINPTFSYELHERFRFGVGLDIVRTTIQIRRSLNFVSSEGAVQLGGSDWGTGFNVGVQADLVPKYLAFGLHYRSAVKIGFKGSADFQDVPDAFQSRLGDQRVTADTTFPSVVAAGLAFTPMDNLVVAADVNWVDWSSFQELAIVFPDHPELNNPLQKRWHAKWNYHVGAEYGVTPALQVRAGFVVDPSPSPGSTLTPDLPDANRFKVTLGAGYNFGGLRADAGYQLVLLSDKESTAPGISGTYGGSAHVFGLTLGYTM